MQGLTLDLSDVILAQLIPNASNVNFIIESANSPDFNTALDNQLSLLADNSNGQITVESSLGDQLIAIEILVTLIPKISSRHVSITT